ncbi:hypothetical protein [Prevotella communis]|uniref:hypothetical protein n=1 Tax=Prevotella communis TaxID=2913614 RepID=UPI001EDB833D|nr:hypothetical protein [Prevotella communis]UKK56942.1 hypothetical protein L6476_01400 [Prevotella communis]
MNKQEDNLDKDVKKLVKDLEPLIQQMKTINDHAVVAYTSLVDDLCRRKAAQNEVELMLDYLLMFAGDDRMLALYKRVCRAYWQTYPESIAFYIMEYRKEYAPESLIGTEYEYLLHEYNDKISE